MPKGLYTNKEMTESILVDLNETVKHFMSGQYVQACRVISSMSQKLITLRDNVDADLKNREQTIETLKEQLRRCGQEVVEVPVQELLEESAKKDGAK